MAASSTRSTAPAEPIKEAATHGEDAGTAEFLAAWTALTDQLVEQAEHAEKAGHQRTAGQLYFRSTNYLCNAERMLANSDPSRIPTYERVLDLAQKAFALHSPRVSRVEIPHQGTTLPGYLSLVPDADNAPAPLIVLVYGLDSTKEHQYNSNFWEELAARGISCVMLDQPGTGEALRLRGLPARIDSEERGKIRFGFRVFGDFPCRDGPFAGRGIRSCAAVAKTTGHTGRTGRGPGIRRVTEACGGGLPALEIRLRSR